jgi:hypothetical protein
VSYSKLKQIRFDYTVCDIIMWKVYCFLLPSFLPFFRHASHVVSLMILSINSIVISLRIAYDGPRPLLSVFSIMDLYSLVTMATRCAMEVWGYKPWWRPSFLHPRSPLGYPAPCKLENSFISRGCSGRGLAFTTHPSLGLFRFSRFILCASKGILPADIYLYLGRDVGAWQSLGLHRTK